MCLYNLLPEQDKPKEAETGSGTLPGPAYYSRSDLVQNKGTPPDSLLRQCPVGNLHHRDWVCKHSKAQREDGVSEEIVAAAVAMNGSDPLGDRGLYPVQTTAVPTKPKEPTFEWVIRPVNDLVTGTIYTDGSRLDGKTRCYR